MKTLPSSETHPLWYIPQAIFFALAWWVTINDETCSNLLIVSFESVPKAKEPPKPQANTLPISNRKLKLTYNLLVRTKEWTAPHAISATC